MTLAFTLHQIVAANNTGKAIHPKEKITLFSEMKSNLVDDLHPVLTS